MSFFTGLAKAAIAVASVVTGLTQAGDVDDYQAAKRASDKANKQENDRRVDASGYTQNNKTEQEK